MAKPFERITVVGAGTLGAQIALLAAHYDYAVTVYDTRPNALNETYRIVRANLEGKGVTPIIPWDRLEEALGRITLEPDLAAAVGHADMVMEVVPEDLDLKKKIWAEIGPLAPPHAVFATNSSSIPVSRMEDATGRPEKCLNIHFYMVLGGHTMADVMGGSRTTPDVLQMGVDWVRSLNFVPLTVKGELLGFCFNRVWRSVKREVLWMWGNGYVDLQDVDRAWMIFNGTKIGPFGLMDAVGLDVVHDIEMVYAKESGDPRDVPPEALKEKIARGELGVKSGRGFYTYPDPEYCRPGFIPLRKE